MLMLYITNSTLCGLPQGVFSYNGIEIDFSECSMDASSFALRISLLKFEPNLSNFPVLETDGRFLVLVLRGKVISILT